ncbi:hypothetical protein KQX54_014772 [Cotesia glomerata]|uniref:Uncharacterized protein n=1 Tax=Cotesia glomerata TaxID=32391 RepID=A0AAV7HXV9_COTGL|nr:hypothetical protein KQX54_014772 [Cotesia glomerata]
MISAAESIIIMMYNGTATNLNDLRCQKYSAAMKASRKTSFNIATLPPTSAAAANHIFRVYCCSCIKSGLHCSHLCKQCTDMCTNKASIPDWQIINEEMNDNKKESSELLEPVDERELEESRLEDEGVAGPSGM